MSASLPTSEFKRSYFDRLTRQHPTLPLTQHVGQLVEWASSFSDGLLGGLKATCAFETPGRYASLAGSGRTVGGGSCTPYGYPGFVNLQYGLLNAHKNIAYLNGQQPDKPEESIKLVNATGRSGYLSCSKDQFAFAVDGRLAWVSAADLLPSHKRFQIARKQSTMTWNFDKPTEIRYEAEDAVKYSRSLWTTRPDIHFFDEPQINAESTDGSFTIALDPKTVPGHAAQAVSAARFPGANDNSTTALERYMAAVTHQFEMLVGRKPKGVPYPVYAVVVAESSFRESNVLVHSYLSKSRKRVSKDF